MINVIRIGLFLCMSLLLSGCVNVFSLYDLQIDGYEYPNDIQKAKLLMKEMGEAHQIDQWDKIGTYQVTYKDEFYGFVGKQSHPFAEQDMTFALSYIPKTFDGQLKIVSGSETGSSWGYQDGQTYRINPDGNTVVNENKDMKFWIPTYQYFIEFPLRIQEASTIDYLGSQVIDGIKTEGLIASWNTVSPQKDIDQYLIWLNADTKQIVKIEYTVRDAYKFVAGGAYFKDYVDYNGIPLPSSMPVESNLVKEGILHHMEVIDFVSDRVSVENLRPLK